MAYERRFVCLANSRKPGGRCIAGKEIGQDGSPGTWIRPISADPRHSIPEAYQLVHGRDLGLLEIVTARLVKHDPLPRQCENHVIDAGGEFSPGSCVLWQNIERWLDHPAALWLTDGQNFGKYESARVPESYDGGASLYLIKVEQLSIRVGADQKIKGSFLYERRWYLLPVTDVEIERHLKPLGEARYDYGSAVLCVSLGDPFNGELYKLIAAVMNDVRFA